MSKLEVHNWTRMTDGHLTFVFI